MRTFLIFGNPLVEKDSLAIKLIPKLKQKFPDYKFRETDPTETLEQFGKNLLIIDVIHNSNKILILNNLKQIEQSKISSMHDFDLALNLKLLLQAGKISSFKIIGIPWNMNEDEALKEVSKTIMDLKSI